MADQGRKVTKVGPVYHASDVPIERLRKRYPLRDGSVYIGPFDEGFHVGTKRAAQERLVHSLNWSKTMKGQSGLEKLDPKMYRMFFNPMESSGVQTDPFGIMKRERELIDDLFSQYKTIPYVNQVEHPGSVSYAMREPDLQIEGMTAVKPMLRDLKLPSTGRFPHDIAPWRMLKDMMERFPRLPLWNKILAPSPFDLIPMDLLRQRRQYPQNGPQPL